MKNLPKYLFIFLLGVLTGIPVFHFFKKTTPQYSKSKINTEKLKSQSQVKTVEINFENYKPLDWVQKLKATPLHIEDKFIGYKVSFSDEGAKLQKMLELPNTFIVFGVEGTYLTGQRNQLLKLFAQYREKKNITLWSIVNGNIQQLIVKTNSI